MHRYVAAAALFFAACASGGDNPDGGSASRAGEDDSIPLDFNPVTSEMYAAYTEPSNQPLYDQIIVQITDYPETCAGIRAPTYAAQTDILLLSMTLTAGADLPRDGVRRRAHARPENVLVGADGRVLYL